MDEFIKEYLQYLDIIERKRNELKAEQNLFTRKKEKYLNEGINIRVAMKAIDELLQEQKHDTKQENKVLKEYKDRYA